MPRLTRLVVLVLLFASGATGLVYELVWSKYLANLLGNSGQAHAIVLATFMGGLALGAFVFGRAADRLPPLALYGALELGVGVYALVFPSVLGALGRGYLAVAPSLDGAPRTAVKLALAACSLLVPTVLMGGTVPALTRFLTRALEGARAQLSLLYAVNSLGAALGVLAAGAVLVPRWGLSLTAERAAVVNLVLGGLAVLLARAARADRSAPVEIVAAPDASTFRPSLVRFALVCVALSGFTAMLYEITWIRLLAIVIGGTTYAFTLILAAFIGGIGLGSLWLTTRKDGGQSLSLFAWLQVALAVAVCLALPFYGRLPYLFHHAFAALNRTEASWPLYQAITFVFCCAVLLVPTFFMGAAFPAAARVALGSVQTLGRQLGGVYLWNTVGTVSGSLLGGLWLLPAIGLEGSFALGLLLNLLAAAMAGHASRKPGRPLPRWSVAVVAASLAVVGLYLGGARGWSTVVASSGRYREWNRTFDSFAAFRAAVLRTSQVQFQADDVFASVLVGQSPAGLKYLRINGKIDASTGDDIDTQVLAGHLGPLLHPGHPKRVLLIGMGAGLTAGSLLTHDLERLDIVEISGAVMQAARFFSAENRFALDDPRTHVFIDDARTFLLLSKEPYDLIVSVPSNPWVSGVSGLFTRDFFQLAKAHLGPGGQIVQWIHTYESSEALVSLVVRTLRDSFAHGTTWVGPQDLVLVAGEQPAQLDFEELARRMAAPGVRDDLLRVKVPDVVTLLSRQVHSDQAQLSLGGSGGINTDDRNRLEYGSAVAYYVAREVRVADERLSRARGAGLALSGYLTEHPLTAEQAGHVSRSLSWVHDADDPLVRSAAEAWLSLQADDEQAALAVARAAWAQKDVDAAVAALAPSIARGAREPERVALWLKARARAERRSHALWRGGSIGAELIMAREALAQNPGHPELTAALDEASRP